jgi:2'-5' RNA ligase
MDQYAVVAFPTLERGAEIEAVRQRIDPMANVLPAHVTVVFPFSAAVSVETLSNHIRLHTRAIQAFDFALSQPEAADGGYVFLNLRGGQKSFVDLHDRLYHGILRPYRSPDHVYSPHVTIGRLPDPQAATLAAQDCADRLPAGLRGSVDSLALFRLVGARRGQVEATFSFEPRQGS